VLQKLLKGKQLDFCHVVSSVASILGGLGYCAYSAANIFMDAFVDKYRKITSIPWVSVNWDAWRFDQKKIKGIGASIVELGITPKEGHDVLNSILYQTDPSQIIVSTTDLTSRIRQWIDLEAFHGDFTTDNNRASFTSTPVDSKANAKQPLADHQVEDTITSIWQKLLGIDQIDINDNFFELGGSSLTALRLFTEIENIFGKKISLATLLEASTVKQLSMIVKQEKTSSSWNSLVKFHDNNSNPPIFLIHGAEGNILLYRELAHHLGPDQPVYGLQSQGLDGGEIKYRPIEEIAAYYITQILMKQPQGPYYLGGYCMGGVVAFEMAQQLIKQGQQINLCAMFETYNPQYDVNPTSFFQKLYYSLENISFHLQNFIKLKTKDKFRFVCKKASVELGRIKEGIVAGFSKTISSLTFKKNQKHSANSIRKIHDQAYYNYKPQFYPGRLTLFRPQQFFSGADDPHFGWKNLANGNLDVFELSVNPRGMLIEPYVKELADILKSCVVKSKENTSHHLN
jgi:thioesterase domain-containing protein/acyl carrier protein